MSLTFSQDMVSKREKQEIFRHSLDEQRRLNQELKHQHEQHQSKHPHGYSVLIPGLQNASERNRIIPGLSDFENSETKSGVYAPGFHGSSSRPSSAGKQPYMAALSEMNGRPPHVRQQQFEKESHYRNMLRQQIEENKKRKDAEKAKLEEDKRKELEEIQRHPLVQTVLRKQHAQFQESPDHPLPSPGRLSPVVDKTQPHSYSVRSFTKGYEPDRRDQRAPAYGTPPPESRHVGRPSPPGERWRADYRDRTLAEREQARSENVYVQQNSGRDQTSYSLQTRGNYDANDLSGRSFTQEARGYAGAEFDSSTPQRTVGDRYSGADGMDIDRYRQQDRLSSQGRESDLTGRQTIGGDRSPRMSAFDRETPDEEREIGKEMTTTRASERDADFVPRSDFDELSSLCRDLLLKQKELRRRLEEREEPDRADGYSQHEQQVQLQERFKPRRGSVGSRKRREDGGISSPRGNGETRRGGGPQSLPGLTSTATGQGDRQWGNMVRRDRKAKPGVAFGSTVPRTELGSKVDRPRVGIGLNQVPRGGGGGGRDLRTSKSEPVQREKNSSDKFGGLRRHRTAVSTTGAVTGGALFGTNAGPASAWARGGDTNRGSSNHMPSDDRIAGESNARTSTRAMGRWVERRYDDTRENDLNLSNSEAGKRTAGKRTAGKSGGGSKGGTICGLLRGGEPHNSSLVRDSGVKDGDSRRDRRDARSGNYDELGGDSTFLAAHRADAKMPMGGGRLGARERAGEFLDPRETADPWNARR